ncbi:hypothetical protein KCP78_09610 [Salmonella enterica subsp. enterica]|nr:hypothetical protein KCP78_09610 [Salmonella enterica subsp. enterica]
MSFKSQKTCSTQAGVAGHSPDTDVPALSAPRDRACVYSLRTFSARAISATGVKADGAITFNQRLITSSLASVKPQRRRQRKSDNVQDNQMRIFSQASLPARGLRAKLNINFVGDDYIALPLSNSAACA